MSGVLFRENGGAAFVILSLTVNNSHTMQKQVFAFILPLLRKFFVSLSPLH